MKNLKYSTKNPNRDHQLVAQCLNQLLHRVPFVKIKVLVNTSVDKARVNPCGWFGLSPIEMVG
jgi:hypothetical protein